MPTRYTSLQLHWLRATITSVTGSLLASVAKHIGMASIAEHFGVARVAEQQTTMTGVSRTLGHAGWPESHTARLQLGYKHSRMHQSLRTSLWTKSAKFKP